MKILVVDDEPDLQPLINQTFRRKIRSGDYNFVFAENGVKALEILQNNSEIDIVLTDINMPEMDGLTLLGHLNENGTEGYLKAIIVSAYGDMENIRTAMNRGAFDFLTKPINLKDLEITIEKTLQESQALKQALIEREKTAAAMRSAKEAAEGANRAKSVFLASMSHELRTPLNAILGFTQLMARDQSIAPKHVENLAIINRSGEHLLALINDVLEMSKIETGQERLNPLAFDMHHLLNDLNDMFRLRAQKKGLQLVFDPDPHTPQYVRADAGKLRQVLINLLGNAVKFTQEGSVTLRLGYRSENFGGRLHFAVEDSGPGIAPGEIEHLFEAFVQPDVGYRAQEGTGLGLAISQQFIGLMGGEISVDSQVGHGSTFTFEIRIEPAEESAIQTATPRRQAVGLEPLALEAQAAAPARLTPDDLSGLPPDWLAALYQASSRADGEETIRLLAQIEEQHTELAGMLREWS
jgi:signal transduction histidine kinase